jgi:hypothetical protein
VLRVSSHQLSNLAQLAESRLLDPLGCALPQENRSMKKSMSIVGIAAVCHEANRAFCASLGDHSQPTWPEAPEWQADSAKKGVEFALANPDAPDSAQHDAWMADKIADGWVYGPVKDAEKKTHPCIVPFDGLPLEQQAKDKLFRSIVAALAPLHKEIEPVNLCSAVTDGGRNPFYEGLFPGETKADRDERIRMAKESGQRLPLRRVGSSRVVSG